MSTTPMSVLVDVLRDKIAASGRSAKSVADEAGIDRSAVSRWLSGQRTPTYSAMLLMAQALGATPFEMEAEACRRLKKSRKLSAKG